MSREDWMSTNNVVDIDVFVIPREKIKASLFIPRLFYPIIPMNVHI